MSTTISVLGGIGLFLLGMAIMTDGLKGLAGSSLRTVLGKAAATPLSGAFWGAIVTLIVQSSSATTMTTIGLVSAGLLTFPQGLGLVFGANVGTTGTGWLVALLGVRVSLSSYALPMIFAGALAKLMGQGRIAASGAALAGFGLVLFGLATLQQGMGGVAEQLHPSDLPAVLGDPHVGWFSGLLGLLLLAVFGLVMTAVMQSSTAAIAVTLSAFFAGAISLEQGCALIIGQNIGTATSSALAAIGASTTAKRLAVAYILFKIIAAALAVMLFPLTMPLIRHWEGSVEGATLLAAYHTAYNVVGVAVLMPVLGWFTRLVERLLPETQSPLTRGLDPAVLDNPIVAVEAVRRTLALATGEICGYMAAGKPKNDQAMAVLVAALHSAKDFLAKAPRSSDAGGGDSHFTGTVHALDHVSRLAEIASQLQDLSIGTSTPEERKALSLYAEVMHTAIDAVEDIAKEAALSPAATSIGELETPDVTPLLAKLEDCVSRLGDLRATHRQHTLARAGAGDITVEQAIERVDTMRLLEASARHAWRGVAHLRGHAEVTT